MRDTEIRQLNADDVEVFKTIRLEALRLEPAAFASKPEDWASLPNEEWRDRLQPPEESESEMIQYSGDEDPGVRLSCQIPVTEELDGIEVRMPKSQY